MEETEKEKTKDIQKTEVYKKCYTQLRMNINISIKCASFTY